MIGFLLWYFVRSLTLHFTFLKFVFLKFRFRKREYFLRKNQTTVVDSYSNSVWSYRIRKSTIFLAILIKIFTIKNIILKYKYLLKTISKIILLNIIWMVQFIWKILPKTACGSILKITIILYKGLKYCIFKVYV